MSRINFDGESDELKEYMEDTVILASFDEVTVTVPISRSRIYRINNRDFNIRDIEGYSHFEKHPIVPTLANRYQCWERFRYMNLTTKNPIDVHHNDFFIMLRFHSEHQHLTLKEINDFVTTVADRYCSFHNHFNIFRKLTPAELLGDSYVSYFEIALDFRGGDLYFLHNELCQSLLRKRERGRKEFDKQGGGNSNRGENEFFNHHTMYIGNKGSRQQVRAYIKARRRGRDTAKFFRFEMVFRRGYLRNHGIVSLNDLTQFDLTTYWRNNFIFIDLDWQKIYRHFQGTSINAGTIAAIRQGYSNIEAYKILRKGLKNPQRFIVPKWDNLTEAISEALKQASLSLLTSDKKAQGAYKTHETVTAVTIDKINNAKGALIGRGIKPSVRKIAAEAGVTHKTAYKYRSLYR